MSEGTTPCNFGFSTKIQDVETGLYYYGYRFYDAEHGRWASRDPIEERGGVNLYGFVLNNSISLLDLLGFRELTSEERSIVISLDELIFKAAKANDSDFSNAIKAVQNSYVDLIQKLPSIGLGNTHRSQITTRALLLWRDKEISKSYLKVNGGGNWKGKNKCNKYVADVTGFQTVVESSLFGGFEERPPIAGEWADTKMFSREYEAVWKVVPDTYNHGGGMVVIKLKQDRGPQLGDIVVFGEPTSVGSAAHVGIYLGHGVYVSATSTLLHDQEGLVIKNVPSDGTPQILYRSTGN